MFRALQNGPAVVRRLATVASSSSKATLRLAAVPSCQVTSSTMAFLSTAAAAKKSAPAVASTTVGGQLLSSLTQENPHINVVRYHHKNRVWTLQHVEFYSEALAIGLAETGLIPGDAVLSWLPQHFSEQMVLQFACSKTGLILYTLDPALAIGDPEASKQALAKALELSKANVLVSQEAGNDVNYIRLAEDVIPELRIFDMASGLPFVTPRFPHLRYPIQTGFDQDEKEGWLRFQYFIVPSGNLDTFVKPGDITAKTPLAGEFVLDGKGIPTGLGKTLTNEQVVKNKVWSTYSAILNKEYHEVEGVGVVF